MAKDLNKVQLTGNLGADPEMRYTAQGSAITTFRVASGRTWKDSAGTKHDDTEWFRVLAWDKLGEICNQYLNKGDRVYIEGRLQTRKWVDRDGQDRYTTEVIAQDMIMLNNRRSAGGAADDDFLADEPPPAPEPEPAGSKVPVIVASMRVDFIRPEWTNISLWPVPVMRIDNATFGPLPVRGAAVPPRPMSSE
ncbi:MAG: single-stranded DNA-binding protein [Blastochloris sp.]|nr:single-stranded DNA-binding protein [Blastochloris sp.]